MTPYDVLCVGDMATDVFIRLSDTHIHAWADGRGHWMDLPFGGKVPFDYTQTVEAGGNAANVAVGLSRLGAPAALAAHAGDDQTGRDMVASLHLEGVDTHLVRLDAGRPSNRNFVLWYEQDRTILVRHQVYDYHWPDLAPSEVPRWIYLSSVGASAEYYDQILRWLDTHGGVELVFQPGTGQIAMGRDRLRGLYRRSQLLLCNREEAVEISGGDHNDMGGLLASLHRLGPRHVVVTDGPQGAYASDGLVRYRVPAYPDPRPPKERTGAGDSFAAAVVAALTKGHTLEEGLAWGPINAMNVVQQVGSQTGLLFETDLLRYLKCSPDDYTVTTW
jgi:2-dehydro-3-deoxygluconokinase